MKQFCKRGIANPNQHADDDHCQSYDARVGNKFLVGRPRNFFEFGTHFANELEDALFLNFLLRQFSHTPAAAKLFRLFMSGVFLAELAILFQLNTIGRILFVFVRPVVAVFAFGAGQGDIRPHGATSLKNFLSFNLISPSAGALISSGGGTRI